MSEASSPEKFKVHHSEEVSLVQKGQHCSLGGPSRPRCLPPNKDRETEAARRGPKLDLDSRKGALVGTGSSHPTCTKPPSSWIPWSRPRVRPRGDRRAIPATRSPILPAAFPRIGVSPSQSRPASPSPRGPCPLSTSGLRESASSGSRLRAPLSLAEASLHPAAFLWLPGECLLRTRAT